MGLCTPSADGFRPLAPQPPDFLLDIGGEVTFALADHEEELESGNPAGVPQAW